MGKLKERYLSMAIEEYLKRLKSYCKMDIVEIPECKCPENPSPKEILTVIEKEGNQIFKKILTKSPIIALCIEGRELSSEDFAKTIQTYHTKSDGTMYFVIGGSFGLSDKIKQVATIEMSFSKMTFTHQMSRVILCEQIYRGFQIISGGKYHK